MPVIYDCLSMDISIPESMLEDVERYLKQAGKIRVVISPVFQPRTLAQNALFHAKINEIAYVTGMDREEIKEEVKEIAMYMGYPCELDESGYPAEFNGKLVPKSSADVSVSEFEILIDAVGVWADQNGIDTTGIWRNL